MCNIKCVGINKLFNFKAFKNSLFQKIVHSGVWELPFRAWAADSDFDHDDMSTFT